MAHPRRTLIVTEKPSQMRNKVPHWQALHPNDQISLFYTPPIGSFEFRIPRDLPLSGVPIILEPTLKRRTYQDLSDGRPNPCAGDFGALAREADHIVCATDYDAAGCGNFADLMEQYEVDIPLGEVSWLALHCEDAASVIAGIERGYRADHPDFMALVAQRRARQYFDFLYLVNALPVFGQALSMVGIPNEGRFRFLSKYTLQLLLMLIRLEPGPLSEGDFARLMQKPPVSRGESPLGSPISRFVIFDWLHDSGCLEAVEPGPSGRTLYDLSERGRRLASLIHKDCFDPYLSSRLEKWGQNWPESKPLIDRYVKTFFGKQKRFQSART